MKFHVIAQKGEKPTWWHGYVHLVQDTIVSIVRDLIPLFGWIESAK